MEHVAIMKRSWKHIEKILSGEKNIESRWYSMKCRPWNLIKKGEKIYFKDSGGVIRIKAEVNKVLQFDGLVSKEVQEILNKYGKDIGIQKDQSKEFFERFKNKKYCILVFLNNITEIKPFDINKTGFGMMSAWITVDSISKIKK
ncbi:MAG: hypothetical protein UT05_C0002G0049 [Parcubacteria group bacterium GW2011_GWF2_38_76]|nr:MAG: hypothetical protein UT05_C0002G0049 [Parcubacteria group bacterium GW2011_GWF2_38_76]HBM45793.1 hypothetical protein [Patescibacteria group bacterium]